MFLLYSTIVKLIYIFFTFIYVLSVVSINQFNTIINKILCCKFVFNLIL